MKPEKLIGRYCRMKVETMFFRKPGLLQITRVNGNGDPDDTLVYGVEIETGREVGPFLRSECAVMRDKTPMSAKDFRTRVSEYGVIKYVVAEGVKKP